MRLNTGSITVANKVVHRGLVYYALVGGVILILFAIGALFLAAALKLVGLV